MDDNTKLPVRPLLNPLTQDDLDILRKVLEDNRAHVDLIGRCEECGLDMAERKAQAEMHRTVAEKIIAQFFPTTVTPPP